MLYFQQLMWYIVNDWYFLGGTSVNGLLTTKWVVATWVYYLAEFRIEVFQHEFVVGMVASDIRFTGLQGYLGKRE